jgi:adenylate cyclase
MKYPEFHYRWDYHLNASPEALWPYVSDTNRFNRDTGVPSVERRVGTDRLDNARRRLHLSRFGVPIDWEEEPFEWVRPFRLGVIRRYSKGPIGEMKTLTEMTPRASGGTDVTYQVWGRPRNPLGLIAIPAQIGILSSTAFARAFAKYDKLASQPIGSGPLYTSGVRLASGGKARLAAARESLLKDRTPSHYIAQLIDLVQRGDDMALSHMRPYALADTWGVARRDVLEMCLRATRLGILELRWDVLCPLCRNPKDSSETLSDLPAHVHCDTCNIDYEANFERSVELTFRPNPAVRKIDEREYCVGGPQLTPHIVAQQYLSTGEARTLKLPLESGRYRLRAMELRGHQSLAAVDRGLREIVLPARPEGWSSEEPQLDLQPLVTLENKTKAEQLLILERVAWGDQAVTAAEVTTMQLFRDLFANEALRPGEKISVGSLTMVFTDLRDSSRLYREVGDAVAFGWVMNHYDILRENIEAEGGAIVKTIGDAVMAVFVHPINAMRAMLKAQHELANPPEGRQVLMLKAGLHYGPCIAVRLNDRLDYFGSTVNFAARLADISHDGGIIVSDNVRLDPEVIEYFADVSDLVQADLIQTEVKGFEDETGDLWRVSFKTAPLPLESQRLSVD